MKRKLTASSLALLMLLAGIMTAFAAEDTVSVYSLGNITAAEDGVYYLPVTVDKFHFDKAEDTQ